MYRILVVDDEANIVDAMCDFIESRRPGEFDVIKAQSGAEAMAFMERMRIDIIISDIIMPAVGGIELLAHISKRWPRCKVVFFTCHDDFDFAHQAANLKCFKYLLKTDGYENVLAAIDEAATLINSEIYGVMDSIEDGDDYLTPHDFFTGLCHGDYYTPEELSAQLSRLNLRFRSNEPVYNWVMQGQSAGTPFGGSLRQLRRFVASVDQELGAWAVTYPYINGQTVFWFLQPLFCTPTEEDFVVTLKGSIELMLAEPQDKGTAGFRAALCLRMSAWEHVQDTYYALVQVLTASAGAGGDIHYYDNSNYARASIQRILDQAFPPGQGNGRPLDPSVVQQLKTLTGLSPNPMEDLLLICQRMYRFVKVNEVLTGQVANSEIKRQLKEMLDSRDARLEDLWETILQVLSYVENSCHQAHAREEQQSIQYAKDYIHARYADNIALTDISEHVYLNASYLSRIFKQECGMNVVDYINTIRINAARELLDNTNMKVADIAERVGFNASSYFSNVFKRRTGQSPKEYRQRSTDRGGTE